MDRIEQLLDLMKSSDRDSFLQHALALEYIKAGTDSKAEVLFFEILEQDPGYVGSYYHLGKLLERAGRSAEAISVYQRGVEEAQKAKDLHAASELRGALENLEEDFDS